MKGRKFNSKTLSVMLMAAAFTACSVVEKGVDMLPATGKISERDKQTIVKTTKAIRSTFADITEEEEYYIGRTVAALILSRYPVYDNKAVNSYVSHVGSAVAIYSGRPEIYAGYHFLVLDSDEVNALSAPGGFIFITRGLLQRCRDEEMLACILAHEVSHVSAKHGLRSIKKSRLVDAFKIIGQEAAERYAPERLSQLTDIFEDVLSDIVEMLIERGYDRKYEYEADRLGVQTALRTGYSPQGLLGFLKTMADESSKKGLKGWFQTHPSAADRMRRAQKEIAGLGSLPVKEATRTARFQKAMKGIS
ncbi:MAG: M48 family metalloprotease [Candidatus Aminicenantales bacterium]